MYSSELPYFIILTVIILLAPVLPARLLLTFDHVIIRVGMVLLLLYLISVGPTAGIFGLIAIGVLYLERNRRKIENAVKKLDAMDIHLPNQATVQQASEPQKTVPVREFDTPDEEEYNFLPKDDTCDITNFEPVAPSINQKAVLSSIYPLSQNESGSASNELYEELGFGHIDGVETLGDS